MLQTTFLEQFLPETVVPAQIFEEPKVDFSFEENVWSMEGDDLKLVGKLDLLIS